MDLIKNSFLEAQQVLEAFISDEKNLGQVKNAGDLLVDMFRQGGKVFSCGTRSEVLPEICNRSENWKTHWKYGKKSIGIGKS